MSANKMPAEKQKHPPGLFVLFGTEAAERFSFYTMRAILVLYLTRIILPGGLSNSEEFRDELRGAFKETPEKIYLHAAGGFDAETFRQVNSIFLTESGLLPELTTEGLNLDAPLPADALQRLRAQEPALQALLERSFEGETLENHKNLLAGSLKKAYAGEAVKEYYDGLTAVVARPAAIARFANVYKTYEGELETLLTQAFERQNIKDEGLKQLGVNAATSLSTDGRGFLEWVVTFKVQQEIRPEALSVYGLYLLLVYLCGLIGGYLSDKVLGSRKAIITGGIVMAAGLFVMWSPGLVFYGLALIIAGNAFFKPNISTIVSGLYPEGDKRRDPAFTIFYMGINLGAFIAIFGAGYAESLAQANDWGWNVGFVLAGVGMLFSLALFMWGQKHLGAAGFPPGREITADSRLGGSDFRDIGVWSLGVGAVGLTVVALWGLIGSFWTALPSVVKIVIGVALIGGAIFGMRARGKKEGGAANEPLSLQEWQQVAVIIILSVFVIFFWAGFEQAGGTMNIFAYTQTDRHIGSWEMPATWFQGFNPLFIIILAPLFSKIWTWNDSKSWGLSTPAKMGFGMIVLGLGFIVMYFGDAQAQSAGKASLVWLIMVYLIHTVGELCLSPIGLSMVTKLSPVRIVSLMMGVWFACTAAADYLSGRLYEIAHHFHWNLWAVCFSIPIGAGLLLLAITPILKRWMHNRG